MKVNVIDFKGKDTGRSVELPDDIFNYEGVSNHSLYLNVKQYLAAQRQGTSKVKGRSEVRGSSRKLHKQKGTGGSRKGNIRNPLYKGGGIVHGPQPRDYTFKLNKKVKDLAKVSALSVKMKQKEIIVVEDFGQYKDAKTRSFVSVLNALKLESKKVLFVSDKDFSTPMQLASRNLQNVLLVKLNYLNVYDILNSNIIVLSETVTDFFKQITLPEDQAPEVEANITEEKQANNE